jgi:hypothetical protein
MKDAGVLINWYGIPCHCRCRHCSLRSGERLSQVSFERAQGIAERFLAWRDDQGNPDLAVEFVGAYSCELPCSMRSIEFRSRHGTSTAPVILTNGMRIRSDAEMREMLLRFKKAGITDVGLTFYGTGETHDHFAARPGDFDYLLGMARAAGECELKRAEAIFLHEGALNDLPSLLATLDQIPGARHCSICTWDYRGRAKWLEEERIRASQVEALPEEIRRLINLERYRSEAEWLQRIAQGAIPAKTARWYFIAVWEDNVERLESVPCQALIGEIRDADDAFHRAIPPLPVLAERYGDKGGDRLYALRDLEWKWTDRCLDEHPEISAVGRFDDLGTCALRR